MLKKFFDLTISQIEEKDDFLFFFTAFCCNLKDNSEILPLATELLKSYQYEEEFTFSIPYLMAALCYVSGDYANGKEYLSNALLINFEGHERFLSMHPSLSEIEEVKLLIERYR